MSIFEKFKKTKDKPEKTIKEDDTELFEVVSFKPRSVDMTAALIRRKREEELRAKFVKGYE